MSVIDITPGGVCTLFSFPLYQSRGEHSICENELKIIYDEKNNTEINYDGNLMGNNKYLLDKLPLLKSFIQREIDYYFYNVMEFGDTQTIYITNSWANYNKPGTKNHSHKHPNSIVSGVYYVAGSDPAPIEFDSDYNKYLLNLNVKRANLYNSNKVWFKPKVNTLFLFPSTLTHEVAKNTSNSERISIAFNTFTKGPSGTDDLHTRIHL